MRLLLLLALLSASLVREAEAQQREPLDDQNARLFAYNVGLGAVIGGVGGALSGGEKPWTRRLWQGALSGAAGGTLIYGGKRLAHRIYARENLVSAWPATFVHASGASLIENASRGEPLALRYTMHMGFVRWEAGRTGLRARLMPLGLAAALVSATEYRFSPRRSIAFLTPVFVNEGPVQAPIGFVLQGDFAGIALQSSVILDTDRPDASYYETAAHELIHVFQHHEYLRASALHSPISRSLTERYGWMERAKRYLYFDFPFYQLAVYYAIGGGTQPFECYFDNWLEYEAEAFAARRPIPVCR